MTTFNYDPALGDGVSQVRFYVGDTNPDAPQLDDGEISFVLVDEDNSVLRAAITCANALYARYANLVDYAYGTVKENLSQRRDAYKNLVDTLTKKMARTSVAPFAGGISVADKQAREQDTDRTPPFFWRNQMDHPGIQSLPDTDTSFFEE